MHWNRYAGKNVKILGNQSAYNLSTDHVVLEIDVPCDGTDRIRESLRMNKDGIYYLHTNNDREDETIDFCGGQVLRWAADHDIIIPQV